MITLALLALVALGVGFFVGSVGVGGVLMVPVFAFIAGLPIHQAAATGLFVGVFAGIWGVVLFSRAGQMSWRMAAPVALGGALGSAPGALLAARLPPGPLSVVIAVIIIGAGLSALRPPGRVIPHGASEGGRRSLLLFALGAASGVGGGLSGAGGAIFAVPVLMAMGYVPVTVVAASTLLALSTSALGSIPNAVHGTLHFGYSIWASLCMLAGMVAGMRMARRVDSAILRRVAAAICVAVGVAVLFVER